MAATGVSQSCFLYCYAEATRSSGSLNLYTCNSGLSASLNLYARGGNYYSDTGSSGAYPYTNTSLLYCKVPEGLGLNLYTLASWHQSSGGLNLVSEGVFSSISGLNLYSYGKDDETGLLNIYTHGW